MTFALVGLVALAGGAALFFLLRARQARQSTPPAGATAPAGSPTSTADVLPAPAATPVDGWTASVQPVPMELAELELSRAASLPPEWLQDLANRLHQVPSPPLSLHKLVSPEFVEHATSGELSGLVMGETLIAAKMLAAVNSPFYGLQKSIDNIGQAVTFLGLNTARSICLRYLLEEPFKAGSPQVQRALDTTSTASVVASELCIGLGKKLGLPDQGSMVTGVILSFLGHFATVSLLPRNVVAGLAQKGFVDRTHAEQNVLGLSAGELGRLLMQHWGLPAGLVEDVCDIDRIVVTPVDPASAQRGTRLAMCYLCARIGELLARDPLRDLANCDLFVAGYPEFHHALSYFGAADRARLDEALRSPDLGQAIQRITQMRRAGLPLPTDGPENPKFGAQMDGKRSYA